MPEQDTRKNINILNWRNYKLPVKGGKETFLDDVIRTERKKGSPGFRQKHTNWNEELNKNVIHGIATKDCFHNKSPRLLIAD